MGKERIDTRAIGLDVGLSFVKWLTGAENLHYGLWTGLETAAENTGKAQAAYTDKLFGYLPAGPLSILDIGGGAGETARKLIALGHSVEIVVPSSILAARCRANAPEAEVHEMTFEAFDTENRYDLCLFSESFQYIPLDIALGRSLDLLKTDGHILIADCFRSDDFAPDGQTRIPGGGHPVSAFRTRVAGLPVDVLGEEDITDAVAPSIDLEQALFHVFGDAVTRIESELAEKRPKSRWLLNRALKLLISRRRRRRLDIRLRGEERTSAAFTKNNRYLITLLGMR